MHERASVRRHPPEISLWPTLRTWVIAGALIPALRFSPFVVAEARSQEQQEQIQLPAPTAAKGPLTTVHGIVRNGVSGEGLSRALVRINGDASTGTLTDGDGRFEIQGVPAGPQEFQILKPGFVDQAAASADGLWENPHSYAQNVIVVAGMPDVIFSMTPVNSIRGQIQLSTGESAQGIQVTLLKRTVQDGRAVWQSATNTKCNSEGFYRFGGLVDGLYAVYTEPAMDSDTATNLVASGKGGNVARNGYASIFYPDSHELAGAAKIKLAGGEQAQADLSLTLEPFRSVTATVGFQDGNRNSTSPSGQSAMNFSAVVMDGQGHTLPYTAQYDESAHTIQTFLPDGSYTLLVTAVGAQSRLSSSDSLRKFRAQMAMLGQVAVSVAGRAVSNLRVPIASSQSNSVQVNVMRTGTQAPHSGVFVTLSQTGGWISDGIVSSYAQGTSAGPLETSYTPPGSYWAHSAIAQKSLCEASFTAGGASLAREPLVVGIAGASATLSLALRDDCASLTLSLPSAVAGNVAGVEKFYTVYAVPDFDSTSDVVPQTLRPSTGGKVTLTGLTPGPYHVYAFDRPVALEYRNPAALTGLANVGQTVTLSPGANTDLVVGVPQP
jgi:hypothetical protein